MEHEAALCPSNLALGSCRLTCLLPSVNRSFLVPLNQFSTEQGSRVIHLLASLLHQRNSAQLQFSNKPFTFVNET
jgi:hypothetical protein